MDFALIIVEQSAYIVLSCNGHGEGYSARYGRRSRDMKLWRPVYARILEIRPDQLHRIPCGIRTGHLKLIANISNLSVGLVIPSQRWRIDGCKSDSRIGGGLQELMA